MKQSRHSQGSVESAAAEVARPGFNTGGHDEEDGCDTSAYIRRRSVKGNMVSELRTLASLPSDVCHC